MNKWGTSEFYKEIATTHGLSRTKLYNIWVSMKQRCINNNHKRYKDYGGRGIKICNEWKNNFVSFYNWAIENNYKEELTLDRINNNGNYEPSNCRFITNKKNQQNRRNNCNITFNGETKCLSQWAKEYNMTPDVLSYRINHGWNIEKAITKKIRKKKKTIENPNRKNIIYNFIKEYWDKNKKPPMLKTVTKKSGLISSSSAKYHINKLIKENKIDKNELKPI